MKYIFLALAIFLMYKMIKGLLKKEAPENQGRFSQSGRWSVGSDEKDVTDRARVVDEDSRS